MHRWHPQWQHWGDEECARRPNRPHQYGSGLSHRTSHFLHRGYHRVRLGILTAVLNFRGSRYFVVHCMVAHSRNRKSDGPASFRVNSGKRTRTSSHPWYRGVLLCSHFWCVRYS